MKNSQKNNKFKISAPTWNDEFELPDGSYSTSDIQDYFVYILKKHIENIDNPSIRIYVNKNENRFPFKIKIGYYLEPLTPETITLLESTKNKMTKKRKLKIYLIQRLLNQYQTIVTLSTMIINKIQEFYIKFVPNKSCGNLLEISSKNHIILKTFNLEFQKIEVWFTDQNSPPLEIEDKINLTLIIK